MNCNTSRFGSKVIHRTAFGTDVSLRSRRTLKAPCKYAALFFHIWYNNLKPAACAAARVHGTRPCADAQGFENIEPCKTAAGAVLLGPQHGATV